MKHLVRYPRSKSELNKLIEFFNFRIIDLKKDANHKLQSRNWLRLCQDANEIRKAGLKNLSDSKQENKQAKKNFYIITYATTTCDVNFHDKVVHTLEKWMKSKGIPVW
jgi:hypothetical protein